MYYVLGIGTNMGERKENIENALSSIEKMPKTAVISRSALYETEPIGYDNQDNFYNIVALVKSDFNPHEMLGAAMGIEATLGRIRQFKNGPRIIDIDIIFAEKEEINTKNLIIPHPRFKERRFVLEPLSDIFTDKSVFGYDFSKDLKNTENQKIKKLKL